ncbi:hypothetical protein GCM10007377_10320 [Galliscardovia ingluviei]|uniref:Uncharacterized protein n=1 Tax=Galliscardovia ingluviei TaxID=1769422 RepID=A0A8J3EWR6_9BIFI|nr:hypothetical protein [Galliscardovia ingluviei]GGI14315.1 hypothetical protein GCM10007377_10320 [Galliscardovia ingluviei]
MSEPNNQQQGNNVPPYPPVQEGSVPPAYPSMPVQDMSAPNMPNQGMPDQRIPGSSIPNQSMPYQGALNQGMPYQGMPAYTPIMLPYDVLPPEPLPQRNMQESGYYLPSGRRTPGPGPYILPMRVGATRRRRTFIIVLCFVLAAILMLSGLALAVTSGSSSDTANTGELDRSSATVLQFDPPTY